MTDGGNQWPLRPPEEKEESVEYDDEGRITFLPEGYVVEYLVTNAGYEGREYVEISETVYGPLSMDPDEIISEAGFDPEGSGLYVGYGDEQEFSISETEILEKDIPKRKRIGATRQRGFGL